MIKQENVAIVTLKKGEGRTIKAGGAWVFNNEIETITGRFHNGDLVIVHDLMVIRWEKVYQPEFQNSCALLTRHVNQELMSHFSDASAECMELSKGYGGYFFLPSGIW